MGEKNCAAIERRDFLKAGGAGLAALASSRYLPALPTYAVSQERVAPGNPLVLRSPQLEVVLDREDALPFQFLLLNLKTSIRGEDTGEKIAVTLCRLEPRTFKTVPAPALSWVDASGRQAS